MHLRHQSEAHRESLKSVLGAPPDSAPLNPQILEVVEEETYRREKVRYHVNPREWGYAYLLIPKKAQGPLPAVFCHHRHNRDWTLGKSEVVGVRGDPSEAFGLELVKRGYVVFAPDALAFEDRCPTDIDPDDPFDAYMHNFTELAVRLLRGETLLKSVIWDASRGLDYLLSRREVDAKRIGFMGHGYGAKMAIWVMAFDERVFAAVAHGSIGSMKKALDLGHFVQVEFAVPRLLQVADFDRVLSLAAPRPFLVSASQDDPDSMDVVELYEKAKRAYTRIGASNRISLYHYAVEEPEEPYMTLRSRHRAYDWLDNWLKPF
ncbi:MAG: prolyl oligopeptidase family serine peptidase [Chloroflexi bacterium]|nr:prolyl oligopeptidase family serine peptidase [Chloroflexota bacterium]